MMGEIRIRVPRSRYGLVYYCLAAALLVRAAGDVYILYRTRAVLRGFRPQPAMSPEFLRVYLLSWAPFLLLLLSAVMLWWWSLRRQSYVLTDRGIRADRVPLGDGAALWSDVKEVRTSVFGFILLLDGAESVQLLVHPWARRELWPELERRLRLRLERKTWSTRRYVCDSDGSTG